jgi:uncharacterized protein (UPF0264 family)
VHLLVSVASAAEATEAIAGEADIIDAKDPGAGALGAVALDVLQGIRAAVAGTRLLSAAIGDAGDEEDTRQRAAAYAAAGAALVKLGFAFTAGESSVEAVLAAAVDGAAPSGVVAVAYADRLTIDAGVLIDIAARTNVHGVLLDTADKSGPGLRALIAPAALAEWIAHAHRRGLIAAVAGQLTAPDLSFVRDAGADIAGVRGAACDGGRQGRVSRKRVRSLIETVHGGVMGRS